MPTPDDEDALRRMINEAFEGITPADLPNPAPTGHKPPDRAEQLVARILTEIWHAAGPHRMPDAGNLARVLVRVVRDHDQRHPRS